MGKKYRKVDPAVKKWQRKQLDEMLARQRAAAEKKLSEIKERRKMYTTHAELYRHTETWLGQAFTGSAYTRDTFNRKPMDEEEITPNEPEEVEAIQAIDPAADTGVGQLGRIVGFSTKMDEYSWSGDWGRPVVQGIVPTEWGISGQTFKISPKEYKALTGGWAEEMFSPAEEPEPEPVPELDNSIGRSIWWSEGVANPAVAGVDYEGNIYPKPEPVENWEDANLVGSYIYNTGNHAPVLDLDFPAQLIPSTTPGHFHLYLDREIGWGQYITLMNSMVEAGLLEAGFRDGAVKQGFSGVRPPGVKKPPAYAPGATLPEIGEEPPVATRPQASNSSMLRKLRAKDAEIAELRESLQNLEDLVVQLNELGKWQ